MNKAFKYIYSALILAALITPAALMPFFSSDDVIGKEEKAELPSLFDENGLNMKFSDSFDLWFSQKLPFRSTIISAKNKIDSGILGRSSNDVIVGKQGQLFYSGEIDSYTGKTMSERRLHNTARTLYLMQSFCKNGGAEFRFMCVPNKSTVYSEYMPSGYIKAEVTDHTRLMSLLEKMGVSCVNVREMLFQHKDDEEELYLRDDSHWTNYGAALGFDEMRVSLGHESSERLAEHEVRCDWQGDLAAMLYPAFPQYCEQYYFNIPQSQAHFMKPRQPSMTNDEIMSNITGDSESMDTIIQTLNRKGQGKIYVSRDSFFRALLPYTINTYGSAYITRFRSFDLRRLDEEGFDEVVYEAAERNIVKITDEAPMIYSLPCDKPASPLRGTEPETMKKVKGSTDTVICGTVSQQELRTCDNIYISLKKNGEELLYEALPCADRESLGTDNVPDNSFSARFRSEELEGAEITVLLAEDR